MHLSCAALVRALFFLPLIVPGQTANALTQQTSPPACPANDPNCKRVEEVTNKADSAATKLGTAAESLNSAAKNLDTTAQKAAEVKDAAEKAEQSKTDAEAAKKDAQTAKKGAEDAQAGAEKAKAGAENAKADAEKSAQKANASGILSRLARRKGASKKPPLNDYVPCSFDGNEDFVLRARPNSYVDAPLTQAEAERIIAGIKATLQTLVKDGKLKSAQEEYLSTKADAAVSQIVGLTPKQAAQKLKELIGQVMADPKVKAIPGPNVQAQAPTMKQSADQSVKDVTASPDIRSARGRGLRLFSDGLERNQGHVRPAGG